jgi:hypothetical protein
MSQPERRMRVPCLSLWRLMVRTLMKPKGLLILAAFVALAAGAYTRYRITQQQILFTWPLRAPNGAPGFALVLNERSWRWVSGHPSADWERNLVNGRTHLRLSGIIAHGFEKVPAGCPNTWQLYEIHPLPGGGIFISGFCMDGTDSPRKARL